MKKRMQVGIVGYGNVGRGVELALQHQPDMRLEAVFTRRSPEVIRPHLSNTVVVPYNEMALYQHRIDVMIVCGQSKADLPEMSPNVASLFNMVDSYDIHAEIIEHLDRVDLAADQRTAIIGVGWDPGLFSMQRLLGEVVLPNGQTDTFWGEGLSQGHTAAVKSIEGVIDAVQYTVPKKEALDIVRSGKEIKLSAADQHRRICYVVADDTEKHSRIAREIKTMPHYFEDYETTVYFISHKELTESHYRKNHGGHVIRTGSTASLHQQRIEFTANLDSNPEFTGSVLTAYARAAYQMQQNGKTGAKTVYDVPLTYLTPYPIRDVIKKWL